MATGAALAAATAEAAKFGKPPSGATYARRFHDANKSTHKHTRMKQCPTTPLTGLYKFGFVLFEIVVEKISSALPDPVGT